MEDSGVASTMSGVRFLTRVRFGGWVARCYALAVLLALPLSAAAAAPGDVSDKEFFDRLAPQVAALAKEKAARTPVQRKLDSHLVYAVKQHRKEAIAPGAPSLQVNVQVLADNRVLVDMNARVTQALLDQITQVGGTVVNNFPQYQAIRALLPLDQVEYLAGLPEVFSIRTADLCVTNTGNVNSEGDTTHRAGTARSTFGVSGSGVKVGVLSDGVDNLTSSQSTGDLGTVTVLSGQAGSGSEGRAMLEIVHDVAPNAALYYATAFGSVASFAQNIRDLRTAGCDIIVDDVTYYSESPFQDGPIAQAVNDVTANGALYFSSAANSGNKSAGTACTWEGDFLDGGSLSIGGESGQVHSFGASTYTATTRSATLYAFLFWSDPLGASSNDYDLFLTDAAGNVLASSTGAQSGTQDPYEFVNGGSAASGSRLVILKYSGATRFLHLATNRVPLTITTAGNVQGHNASEATNAFCVAAAPAHLAGGSGYPTGPYPNPFTSSSALEPFTSDGPRRMFYYPNGTAITPGNLTSTGGTVYAKPDFTAADGVATTVTSPSGFNPFYGTSAAAPHAAAIAALLKSVGTGITNAQIRNALIGTAIDIGAAGWDRDSGAGIVMAYPAVQSLLSTSTTATTASTTTTTKSTTTTTGSVTTTTLSWSAVVDNTDNAADKRFSITLGEWEQSSYRSGYYGTNYALAAATGGAETARCRFVHDNLPAGPCAVYARWSAWAGRTATAPYEIHHASGTATVTCDQSQSGGAWVYLGTYTFISGVGGHVVELSNASTTPGAFVIADAVQFQSVASPTTTLAGATTTTTLPAGELVIDNADTAATKRWQSVSGTWNVVTLTAGYYGTNYCTTSSSATATVTARSRWSTTLLPAGNYAVYAWWTEYASRPTNAPYVVKNGSVELATVLMDQTTNGGKWNYVGAYTFSAGGHMVEVHNGSTGSGKTLCADAVKFVPAGTATTSTLATTTTTLAAVPLIIDNSDTASTKQWQNTLGLWTLTSIAAGYYGSDYCTTTSSATTTVTARSRWSTTLLSAGSYQVYAWWTAYSTRPTSAPYVIKNGSTELGTVRVNQTLSGGQWNLLGTYTFSAGGHAVEVHNGSTGTSKALCADAVKFVKVGP